MMTHSDCHWTRGRNIVANVDLIVPLILPGLLIKVGEADRLGNKLTGPHRSSCRPSSASSNRLVSTGDTVVRKCSDRSDIDPKGKPVCFTALEGKVISIHRQNLAGVISGLVGAFVVHIVRNTNLREHARTMPNVIDTLLTDGRQLFFKGVAYSRFANLDRERRTEVLPA